MKITKIILKVLFCIISISFLVLIFYITYTNDNSSVETPSPSLNTSDNVNLDEKNPRNREVIENEIYLYAQYSNYQKIIELYTELIVIEPTYANAYFGRAGAYIELNDHEKALIDYKSALNIVPENRKYGALTSIAVEQYYLEQHDDMCKTIDKINEIVNGTSSIETKNSVGEYVNIVSLCK